MIRLLAMLLTAGVVAATVFAHAGAQEMSVTEDVGFISRLDGTEQRYVLVLPPGFQTDVSHDVVIALHGHGSDRWQFVKNDRPECAATRDAAAKGRMILVSPDYRAKTSWMGPAAEADLLQILDDLHGRFRIRNVVVSGGSMGGTSALAFAAMHPECVDGVVALNGTANLVDYTNFADAIADSYGGSRLDKPDVYRQRSAEFFSDRLTMPIAVTTGGQDTLVPPDSTLRLAEALKKQSSPVLSIHRPEGGHATDFQDTMAAFRFVFDHLQSRYSAEPSPVIRSFDQTTTIVCLGDSVTGVYYHTGGRRAYPEMLELALRSTHPGASIQVFNAGISGHTTVEGLARLAADVLAHHPTLVTISFGLNDMTRVSPDQFRANLTQLVDRCQAQQSLVVLCTPNAVIDTADRPIAKLEEYCDIIRAVADEKMVRQCDQYRVGERLQLRAPRTWRLTMSDEIHPNMDGHKRMAEELCRCVSGSDTSLDAVPPEPALSKTRTLLGRHAPVKVLAMEPVAGFVEDSIRRMSSTAQIEMTKWPISGKSLPQLEQEANRMVRAIKPQLVVLTIPADTMTQNEEQLVHSVTWIMNWSLSFGRQEWDCVVIHPAVLDPAADPSKSLVIERLVHAQHLEMIRRDPGDSSSAEEIIARWFERQTEVN